LQRRAHEADVEKDESGLSKLKAFYCNRRK